MDLTNNFAQTVTILELMEGQRWTDNTINIKIKTLSLGPIPFQSKQTLRSQG